MDYRKYGSVELEAWAAFASVFEQYGVDRKALYNELDRRDCFNGVTDAVLELVKLEE